MNTKLLFAMVVCGMAAADTIQLADGTRHDNIVLTPTSTMWIVADPVTGKTWSVDKDKAQGTVTDDHAALLAQWRKVRGDEPSAPVTAGPSPSGVLHQDENSVVYKDEKGTVVIKHHGNAIPTPEINARAAKKKDEYLAQRREITAAKEQALAEQQAAREKSQNDARFDQAMDALWADINSPIAAPGPSYGGNYPQTVDGFYLRRGMTPPSSGPNGDSSYFSPTNQSLRRIGQSLSQIEANTR